MSEAVAAAATRQAATAEPGAKPELRLQRKCACGQHTVAGGECEECRKKRLMTQRWSTARPRPDSVARGTGASLSGDAAGADLSAVRTQTPALRTAPRIQREEAGAPAPESAEPTEETQPEAVDTAQVPQSTEPPPPVDAASAPESESSPESAAPGARTGSLLAEDDAADVAAGQMRKTEFLDQLQRAVCAQADEALAAAGRSTEGCPYIAQAFTRYRGQSASQVEAALRRYAPETRDARTAAETIPILAARVRQGVERWVATGEIGGVPDDAAVSLPSGGAGAMLGSVATGIGSVLFKAEEGGARPDDPAAVHAKLGGGQAMESGVRGRMERAFGRSFGGVRMHTDATARQLSAEQNARAFTVGGHVAFAAGEYRPGTPAGDALIAHELAHTIQQGDGSAAMQAKSSSGAGYDALEHDADRSAAGVVSRLWGTAQETAHGIARNAGPALRSGLSIQRCSRNQAPITSETVVTTPTPRSRTTIGVGEEVNLTHTAGSATWSTTAGTLSATTGATVKLTAPDTAQPITVQAGTDTKDFTVIAPTTVSMDREPGTGVKHHLNQPDSGIQTRVFLGPDTVNFSRARYRELDVPGVPTTPGVYDCNTFSTGHCAGAVGGACPDKALTTTVVSGMGTQSLLGDCAYSGHCGTAPPFLPGSITVSIPYEYKVGTGSFHAIRTVDQVHTLAPDASTLTSSKAGATGSTTVAAASVVIPQCP